MKNILFLILCGGMVACGAPTETPKKEEKKVAPTPVVPTTSYTHYVNPLLSNFLTAILTLLLRCLGVCTSGRPKRARWAMVGPISTTPRR